MKNISNNGKYILLNSSELFRATYERERIFSHNDFETIYHKNGEETIDRIFDKNSLPTEFRKVALKVNFSLLRTKTAEDCITKTKFVITKDKVDGKALIKGGVSIPYIYDYVNFKSSSNPVSNSEVLQFYRDLKKASVLDKYIYAMADFYSAIPTVDQNVAEYKFIMDLFNNDGVLAIDMALRAADKLKVAADMVKLAQDMSLYELKYLVDNTEGFAKSVVYHELKDRLYPIENEDSRIKLCL